MLYLELFCVKGIGKARAGVACLCLAAWTTSWWKVKCCVVVSSFIVRDSS